MKKILQLDSNFRNKQTYPFSTEFTIEVNGTPPSDPSNDVRSLFLCPDLPLYRWVWIGNTTVPMFAPGVVNNAVKISFYALSPTRVIIDLSPDAAPDTIASSIYQQYINNTVQKTNDYFVGCVFVYDQQAAVIVAYDGNDRSCLLATSIQYAPQCFACRTNPAYIVNTTCSFPNNILVLESNRYLPQTRDELLLIKGLNTTLIIHQVRTNRQYEIETLSPPPSRNVLLRQDLESYRSHDLFLVYSPGSVRSIMIEPRFCVDGIFEFAIRDGGLGYHAGQECAAGNALFRVTAVNERGAIVALDLLFPGSTFQASSVVSLTPSSGSGTACTITILNTSPYMIAFASLDVAFIAADFVVFFPEFEIWQNIKYFLVKGRRSRFVYFVANPEAVIALNDLDLYHRQHVDGLVAQFVRFQSVYPNVVVPLVSYNQPVCYEVEIVSISLPNLPVCGINLLLADFPYVMITLTNSTNGSADNRNLLITNNPHATFSNFICPIANIRNPDIVKYVVVNSNQAITFKFNPTDNLRFRVDLPNGTLLRYNTKTSDDFLCDVDLPINSVNFNQKLIYTNVQTNVSAVFSLRII